MTAQFRAIEVGIHTCRLAIIGAAFRLPGCDSLTAVEQLLFRGGNAITEIPDARWNKARFFDPRPGEPGKSYTFAAGCISTAGLFDAGFFGLSPREAMQVDPQQRLLLELVQEAIEDACVPATSLAGRNIGVYVGGSSYEFALRNAGDVAASDNHTMQGSALSSLANRISYAYDLRGPSLTVDTACSSSMVALHLASAALERGEIEMAIMGGVNMLLAPQSFVGFARASMLSRKGYCHAFDARADGYVRAEGGGVLVLTRAANAAAMGAVSHAEILAVGANSDGSTHGFSMPSTAAQADLLTRIYQDTNISPDRLGYFEAHGTGTPVGDVVEAQAIGQAIGQRRRTPLPIGSIKSNLGHLEAASAMAAIAKALIVLRSGRIPRSLHNEMPNPNIAFGKLGIELVGAEKSFPADGLIGINSFGFGGTNAHAVLAKPAPALVTPEPVGHNPPLLLSAHSQAALSDLARRWHAYVEGDAALAPALRSAARGRDHHSHRAVVGADSRANLQQGLTALAADVPAQMLVRGEAVKGDLAFVFSGNGSQWAGMGHDALSNSPGFRSALTQVDLALAPHLGWSVAASLRTPDADALRDTGFAQPLLFAIQAALVLSLQALGIRPAMVAGHSAGEVAAAFAAGALTLDQASRVIAVRSRHQRETRGTGRMVALRLPPDAAAAIADSDPLLEISAINASDAVTIAGPAEAIARLIAHAAEQGWHATPLDLDYAFHSRAMDPIRQSVINDLAELEPKIPSLPFLSSVTGDALTGVVLDADYWWRNVRQPVLFADAARQMIEKGARIFLEIGPRPVLMSYLRDLLKAVHPTARMIASLTQERAKDDVLSVIAARCHVAGASIAQSPMFEGPRQVRGLPGTCWQRARHETELTSEALAVLHPVRDHVLLGYREHKDAGTWWNHLAVELFPWLADHVVAGRCVLPAAAMIDMALSAAAALHPKAETLEIQGLEIAHFLALDSGTRSTRFQVAPDGRFSLSSFPRMDENAVTRHATGRLMSGVARKRSACEIKEVLRTIPASEIYGIADRLQLCYGPAFRTVRKILVQRDGTACAELTDPQHLPVGSAAIDPAVLDGAMQALLAFAHDDAADGTSLVPWRFGRIVLHDRTGIAPKRAQLMVRRRGPRSVAADIILTDAAGRVQMELLECWFVRLAAAKTENPGSFFRQVLLPTAKQSQSESAVLDWIAPAPASPAASVVLTDAFLAQAIRGRPAGDLPGALQDWLTRHGAATALDDLPDADTLWRTIFYGAQRSAAEAVLASALADRLATCEVPFDAWTAPPVLLDQMLHASSTARAAESAIATDIAAYLNKTVKHASRVAMVGCWGSGAMRRIVDLLMRDGRPLRLEFFCDGEAPYDLAQIFIDQPEIRIRPGEEMGSDQFDLVVSLWAMGTHCALKPSVLASMLAPGGVLIAAEAAEGGLAALLRLGAVWHRDGLDAGQIARALTAQGLTVQGPVLLASQVWPAARIIAIAATVPARQSPSVADPIILAPTTHPWKDALAGILPHAPWRHLFGSDDGIAAETDILLLVPKMPNPPDDMEALATLLARIGSLCLTFEAAGAARVTLAMSAPAEGDFLGAALSAMRRAAMNETSRLVIRLLRLDPTFRPDDAAAAIVRELSERDGEPDLVIGATGRLAPRLMPQISQPPTHQENSEALRLCTDRPGALARLAWTGFMPPPLAEDEIAIDVMAAGLNFRDVMWALGMLPDEALLDGFSGPSLGLECAGIVLAVGARVTDLAPGDRVAALAPAALATIAITRRNAVLKLAADQDFALAAGMPVAFMTAIYTLGHLARIAPDERVLIHGGAGGVGLAAIQYAQHRGAVVFASAGDPARRRMLQRLGATAVFDSRSASFHDDLLTATGGEGVDVVLNSLAGDLMERSLSLLKPFGRFVEIGKRDLYMDSRIGLRALRRNASYFVADLDELAAARPAAAAAVLEEMQALLRDGHIRPLPVRHFRFSEATAAFRLMQGSGHIGKIVLERDAVRAPAALATLTLRADGIYVVTGGIAGFGLEAARFLVAHGARTLALISRRGRATPGAEAVIAEFAAAGVTTTLHPCDVGDSAMLATTLDEIRAQGPIRGVLHAAMILDDARLSGQDAAHFHTALQPKLGGALALDALTRGDALDLFILFSSIVTAIGNPGQTNYIAANAGLEALAQRRRHEGLAGTAIMFGPIADAGYLARQTRVADMLARALGSRHLTATEALQAVPALLTSRHAVAGIACVQWGALTRFLPRVASPLMDHLPKMAQADLSGGDLRSNLAEMTPEDAIEHVMAIVRTELSRILHLPAGNIAPDQAIEDFGIDSLMTVELATALDARAGCSLPPLVLNEHATLRSVSASLVRGMTSGETGTARSGGSIAITRHETAQTPSLEPTSKDEALA